MNMRNLFYRLLIGCLCGVVGLSGRLEAEPVGGPKTVIIQVKGTCAACKTRIEAALKLKGVKKATWSILKKEVTIVYQPDKITPDALHQALAMAGHDTDKYKAPDSVYAGLPACCHYER
jgi:copper chaperone CopZ